VAFPPPFTSPSYSTTILYIPKLFAWDLLYCERKRVFTLTEFIRLNLSSIRSFCALFVCCLYSFAWRGNTLQPPGIKANAAVTIIQENSSSCSDRCYFWYSLPNQHFHASCRHSCNITTYISSLSLVKGFIYTSHSDLDPSLHRQSHNISLREPKRF
jgi:hypothetical protein